MKKCLSDVEERKERFVSELTSLDVFSLVDVSFPSRRYVFETDRPRAKEDYY